MLRSIPRAFGPAESRLPRPFLFVGTTLAVTFAIWGAAGSATAADCVDPVGGETIFEAGSLKKCTVPAGVTRITVEAWGAQGGENPHLGANTDHGGAGGHALRTNYLVTPGATLFAIGGQAGGNASRGGKGSGGGGGSSGVYTNYPPRNLNDVVVIAGAGGGAGCDDGGWGGGSFNTNGSGGKGFMAHICSSGKVPGGGGAGGVGGTARFGEGAGFGGLGGNGGQSPSGGYGGWGGSELKGEGGRGIINSQGYAVGGAGGGGYGGGGGGDEAGGGGGGSYPASIPISPNWGNGQVRMSVSTGLTAQIPMIRKSPPGLTKKRRAVFTFGAAQPTKFECSLSGHRLAPQLRSWTRCGGSGLRRSGKVTYRDLHPGIKVFQIKQSGQDGTGNFPERREWRVAR